MAFGLHWEWRSFGSVSSVFANRYCTLQASFSPQTIEDFYLWVPKLDVNAKFREGAEGGLKFKRIKNQDGPLEQWHEDRGELFDFPLDQKAWDTLSKVLATVNIHLPSYPLTPPNRDATLEYLKKVGCPTITVKKLREAKLWQGLKGKVKVEWACISSPQACISIGLETWEEESQKADLNDELAKADIHAAIKELQLDKEPLRVMNYIQAVEIWASGEKI